MTELLKVDDVARALNIAKPTAYKLMSDGHLKTVRVGKGPRGSVRVHPEELERFQREGIKQ